MTSYSTIDRPLPGSAAFPLIGAQLNKLRLLFDPITYLINTHRRYGMIAGCTYDDRSIVMAFGAEMNRQVLSNTQVYHNLSSLPIRFPLADSPITRMTSGLIFMNGESHRQHRQMIMPAFHKKRIENYHQTMVDLTESFIAGWQAGQTFDIALEMQHLALEITSRILFGLDSGYDTRQLGEKIYQLAVNLYSIPVLMLPHWLSRTYRQSLVMAHELERIGLKMIAHKREVLTQSDDVFATLLEMRDADTGEALTNAELIGHMTILFVAGHESTRNTLTWTLLLLAQHPRILQALYDELHVKLNGAPPTLEQLNQLSLLEAVIKEAMRLMPTTPYITRRVIAETELGGQHLPPETIVVISPYVTHRSAELYANPQRFQPERWFDLSPSAYEFLPFGAGGRMCVAAVFGMMELKIILSILLQRHWFKIKDGAQIDRHVGVTMGSKHGLPVRVEPVGTKITPSKLTGHIHQMVLMED